MQPSSRDPNSTENADLEGLSQMPEPGGSYTTNNAPGFDCTTDTGKCYSVPQSSNAPPISPRSNQKLASGIRTKSTKHFPVSSEGKHTTSNQHSRVHHTGFAAALHKHPPPVPSGLIKISRQSSMSNAIGPSEKVKTVLRLLPPEASIVGSTGTCLTVDKKRNQATLMYSNAAESISANQRRVGLGAPKLFALDAIFTEQDSAGDLCAFALPELVQAVVNGLDSCLIVLSSNRPYSAETFIGSDKSPTELGIIPCAISWLFKLIAAQKEHTGARFSVRVSASEIDGQEDSMKDLLLEVAQSSDASGSNPPGVHLRDDISAGSLLENQSELRAPTPEKAAFYLDSALNARARSNRRNSAAVCISENQQTPSDSEFTTQNISHLFFTLHVYQYRIEKCGDGSEVAGGRSRLHLIEIGTGYPETLNAAPIYPQSSPTISTTNSAFVPPTPTTCQPTSKAPFSTSSILSVILSLLSGQRYIPHRNSQLARLLRDALGSVSCQHCIVIEASPIASYYAENLQLLQLTQRVQRHRKRRISSKVLSSGSELSSVAVDKPTHMNTSEDNSSCDSFGLRRANRIRMHTGLNSVTRRAALHKSKSGKHRTNAFNGTQSSERDYTSSSEQSCDTVIFLGQHSGTAMECDLQQTKPRLSRIVSGSAGETQSDTADSDHPNPSVEKPLHSNATQAPAGLGENCEQRVAKKEGRVKKFTETRRATPRTNIHAWSRAAVKNAIETLSTQKEQWVDGPKANFSPKKSATVENIGGACTTQRDGPVMEDKNTQSEFITDQAAVNNVQLDSEAQKHLHFGSSETYVPPSHEAQYAKFKSHSFSQTMDYGSHGNAFQPDGATEEDVSRGGLHSVNTTHNTTDGIPNVSPCLHTNRLSSSELNDELGVIPVVCPLLNPIATCTTCPAVENLITRSRSNFEQSGSNLPIPVAETDSEKAVGMTPTSTLLTYGIPGAQESHPSKSPHQTRSSLKFNPFVTDWIQKHRVLTNPIEIDEQCMEKTSQENLVNEQPLQPNVFPSVTNNLMGLPKAALNYPPRIPIGDYDQVPQGLGPPTPHTDFSEVVCKCRMGTTDGLKRTTPSGASGGTGDELSGKEINSNFARIAEWVKSVSMETGDKPTLQKHIVSTDKHCLTVGLTQPKFQESKIRVPRLFCSTGLSDNTTCAISPPSQFTVDKRISHSTVPLPELEPSLSQKQLPLPCVPIWYPGQSHYRPRRGRSVPPRGLMEPVVFTHSQPCSKHIPTQLVQNDLSNTRPSVLSSAMSNCIEQNYCPGSLENRRPDGSSNPRIHSQEQEINPKINIDTPIDTEPHRCKHFIFCGQKQKAIDTRKKRLPAEDMLDEPYMSVGPSFFCANIHHSLQKKHRSPDVRQARHSVDRPQEGERPLCFETPTARRRPRSYCSSVASTHSDETGACNVRTRHLVTEPAERRDPCSKHVDNKEKRTKEALSKSSKSRLGFLTSPIFGRRKSKLNDVLQNVGRPDNEKQKAKNFHNNSNGTQPHVRQFLVAVPSDPEFKQSASSPSRHQTVHLALQIPDPGTPVEASLDRARFEHKSVPCSHMPSFPSRNLRNTVNPRWPTTTHGSPKISSKQSSSGHGSDYSSTLYPIVGIDTPECSSPQCHQHHCSHYQRSHRTRHAESNLVRSTTLTKHRCRICFHRRCDCVTEGSMDCKTLDNRTNAICGSYGRNKSCCNSRLVEGETDLDAYRKFVVTSVNPNEIEASEMRVKALLHASQSVKSSVITRGSIGVRLGGGHTSSGYESIVRDSEASSHADSTSGSSIGCHGDGICVRHTSDAAVSKTEEKKDPISGTHTAVRGPNSKVQFGEQSPISVTDKVKHFHTNIKSQQMGSPTHQELGNERHMEGFATSNTSPTSRTLKNGQQPELSNVNNHQHSKSLSASSSSSTSRRSHSAPPCSEDTSEATTSSPISVRYVPPKATTTVISSMNTSLDTSGATKPEESVGAITDTHQEEIQEMLRQIRYERIYDLLAQQDTLKMELMKAKDRLMIDPSTWSFDVYVAEQMDPDDDGFLDALEVETEILQKRVDACKSRVMLVTCFDIHVETAVNGNSALEVNRSGY